MLPLSPSLCAFLYDPFVYKVGNRRDAVVVLQPRDVKILNSLQVQSAEICLYAHHSGAEPELQKLVASYAHLRKPNSAAMKSFPQNEDESLIMFSDPAFVLPKAWQFCRYIKNIQCEVGDRRDPGTTHMIQMLIEDIESNPHPMELDQRLEKMIAMLPKDQPVNVMRRSDLSGVKLPTSPKDWRIGM